MLEQGIVLLIQAGIGTLAPGGFAVQLPMGQITASTPRAWVYRSLASEPSYHLGGQDGRTCWYVGIDCCGYTMKDAIQLYRAIDGVLRGLWSGVLPDEDKTVVQGIFREPGFVDGFNDANRTFVRSVEYRVIYEET